MRVRRTILVVLSLVVVVAAILTVVVHLPGVQRIAWRRLTTAVEESTGWRVEADSTRLRVIPARLEIAGLKIAGGAGAIATVDRLSAGWRWRRLLAAPHRLERVDLDGVSFHPDALPPPDPSGEAQSTALWDGLEIGVLRVRGGRVGDSLQDIEYSLDGVAADGRLEDGLATVELSARRLRLIRSKRILNLGPLKIHGGATEDGLHIEDFELGGAAVHLRAAGSVKTTPGMTGRFELRAGVDVAALAGWWDPNLAAGVDPRGQLDVEGFVSLDPATGPEVELAHRGRPLTIAGYDIETVDFSFREERPSIRLGDPGWGRASVSFPAPATIEVDAQLDEAPVDRLLRFLAPRVAEVIRGPSTLTGEIDGVVSYPLVAENLEGRADLELSWADGHVSLRVEGAGTGWEVAKFEARAAGATIRGSGRIEDDRIGADLVLSVDSPRTVFELVEDRLPELSALGLDGGPIDARVRVGGVVMAPTIEAELGWDEPVLGGRRLESCAVEIEGDLNEVEWQADVRLSPETPLVLRGTARPLAGEAEGTWRVEASSLAEAATVLELAADLPVDGRLIGTGTFAASAGDFRVDGEIDAEGLDVGDIVVSRVEAAFTARRDHVEIPEIAAEVFGGMIHGSLTVPLTGLDQHFRADLAWRDLDLEALPYAIPEPARGRLEGRLGLGGRLTHPQGDLELTWIPTDTEPLLNRLRFLAGLEGGVVRVAAEEAQTAAGSVMAEATAPLGDLARPEWLWPDAPGGAVRASLDGRGLRSEPLRAMFGLPDVGVEVASDLRAEVSWDPTRPDTPFVLAEANGLRVLHRSGELVAEGPLTLTLDGNHLEVAPVVLAGMGSRIEAEAVYDPVAELVTSHLRAELSREVFRMLPLPVTVKGLMTVTADLEAPASVSTSVESMRGVVTVEHGDGTIVMRDPPLEIKDLHLTAELENGAISNLDGSAMVNRGGVIFGGGWEPASGQGVVLELEGVTAYTAGILTRWNGDLALEPHPEKMARIAGDLELVAGLWDERLDLASAVLGGGSTELAGDDPMHDIELDLSVRGRAGVQVDNNLGRFNANWDVLRVAGTAAVPVIRGEVRIAPGGVLGLAGHEVTVRRGSLEFTGDPSLDPVLEIVPETDTTIVGGEEDESFDATLMATRGLAEGISSVLGFENETLSPAEIAVQTEKDPSERFMVGQRLNRNVALFLATNLTDVQDRTTMLQLWNIEGLKGLALQGYQETADDNAGVNAFQRFEWGGARAGDGRPEIHRLRLDGEWPISKRKLRRSTRLRRGQLFDPFLLFVGAVRMERTLAELGYQDARVTAIQEGPDHLPTMVFTCEPGPRQPVEFVGDKVSELVRREVTALYRAPPLENLAFDNMRAVVQRQLTAEGFIEPDIVVEWRQEAVVVDVRRGEKVELTGPFLDGVPVDAVRRVVALLGTSTAMATMVNRPDWASATVERAVKNAGYHQARVLDVALVPVDGGKAEVRIAVDAGPREAVDLITLAGRDPLGMTGEGSFAIQPGVPLDRPAIDSATRDLRDAYIDAGYREAVADNTIRRDAEERWVVEIRLDPGRQRVVRDIRITGRRHVSERVLGKGVTLDEGEILTNSEVDRSASRIANFSPIERVNVVTVDKGPSGVDLEFDVSEKARWVAEVGGGWSTERGFGAAFGLRDDNILARGIGLNLRGSWDATERKIFLIGSLPPVPGGRLSFITTVGYTSGDAPEAPESLNKDIKLASLEASYRLPRGARVGVYYRWTDTRTYEKVPDDFFPLDNRLKVGTLGVRTVFDRFDNLFDPRSGWGLTSDIGWSGGVVGSDLEYVTWLTNYSLALEPYSDSTWMQSVRVGLAEPLKNTNLHTDARFFAGGQSSIRGFDLNSVIPLEKDRDGTLVPTVPPGGGALFILNEELRIPVWGALRLAVFADIGQVWESWRTADTAFSVGVGLGVRWSTPIGPLWADVAWPVANVGISSDKPKFYLGIGRPF